MHGTNRGLIGLCSQRETFEAARTNQIETIRRIPPADSATMAWLAGQARRTTLLVQGGEDPLELYCS